MRKIYMSNLIKEIIKGASMFFVFVIVIIAIMYIVNSYHIKNNNIIESDVELQKRNDSLKIEVDNLDSIKNAKVIEVKTLDNDSTIKLFYQLIK